MWYFVVLLNIVIISNLKLNTDSTFWTFQILGTKLTGSLLFATKVKTQSKQCLWSKQNTANITLCLSSSDAFPTHHNDWYFFPDHTYIPVSHHQLSSLTRWFHHHLHNSKDPVRSPYLMIAFLILLRVLEWTWYQHSAFRIYHGMSLQYLFV